MVFIDTDDALLLSDEEDSEFLRDLAHKRLSQLKTQNLQSAHYYGCIEEITHERQLLDISSVSTGRLVIHFSSPSFARCRTMREHLAKLAKSYPHVRFVEVLAQETPFLVTKWSIRVLPCIVCIIDGNVVDRFFYVVLSFRIVGFDELGGTDDWETPVLEKRLFKSGTVARLTF